MQHIAQPTTQGYGASLRFFALMLACFVAAACKPAAQDLPSARNALRRGTLNCEKAEALSMKLAGDDKNARKGLAAQRLWIDCMDRTGRLAEAANILRNRPTTPPVLYARALVRITQDPAALKPTLQLLNTAGQRWPKEDEFPYRAGLLLLANEEAKRALPLLKKACNLRSTAHCTVALAHAMLDLDRPTEALEEVRKLSKLSPRPQDVARGRSLISRLNHRRSQIPQKARIQFAKALELLNKKDRPYEAATILRRLTGDHPHFARAYTLFGICQLRLGNEAEAVVAIRHAARLDKRDPLNPKLLAATYQRRGQLERALGLYQSAHQLDPLDLRTLNNMAEIHLLLGLSQKAAQTLDKSIALGERRAEVLMKASKAHLRAGNGRAAEVYLLRLVAEMPNDFESRIRLAEAIALRFKDSGYKARDLLERAKKSLQAAKALRGKNIDIIRVRAMLSNYGP